MTNWLRWATPIVFLLAGLALALPAVSFRVDLGGAPQTRLDVTYTGLDPALNGDAEATASSRDGTGPWRVVDRVDGALLRHPDPGAQVVGLLALVVLGLGIATATLRGRTRAGAALGAAVLAALTVSTSISWTRGAMIPRAAELTGAAEGANNVAYRYGFWLVLGLLAVAAAANARAATAPASDPAPAPADVDGRKIASILQLWR